MYKEPQKITISAFLFIDEMAKQATKGVNMLLYIDIELVQDDVKEQLRSNIKK